MSIVLEMTPEVLSGAAGATWRHKTENKLSCTTIQQEEDTKAKMLQETLPRGEPVILGGGAEDNLLTWREPTCRRQLVLHLQQNPLSHVLQQADDLLVPQFGQIDAVDRLDVVAHV